MNKSLYRRRLRAITTFKVQCRCLSIMRRKSLRINLTFSPVCLISSPKLQLPNFTKNSNSFLNSNLYCKTSKLSLLIKYPKTMIIIHYNRSITSPKLMIPNILISDTNNLTFDKGKYLKLTKSIIKNKDKDKGTSIKIKINNNTYY